VNSNESFSQTYPIHWDGSYRMILNPGDYRLSYGSRQRVVHVGDAPVNLDLN
jgi:hypothetical protein